MGVMVDLDDSNLDRLTDCQHLRRMVDATPSNVGDVQQAVDAAEIDEGAVIRDVLYNAVDDLTFFKVGDDLVTLFSALNNVTRSSPTLKKVKSSTAL